MTREQIIAAYANNHRNFIWADLSGADLSGAGLSGANLSGANLGWANLSGANLSGANLSGANLNRADLSGANLSGANLGWANLSGADLSGADLSRANLSRADLSGANLNRADLSGANLGWANLSGANLSGVVGLPDAAGFFEASFARDAFGWIAYKVFGLHYGPPTSWVIEPGAVHREVVNPCPTTECGCGVSVGTLDWIREHNHANLPVWRVRIPYRAAPTLVVPYAFDGKVRCGEIELLEIVSEGESK